ncbi:membrane protein [Mycetocola zhadangensis]|nr:membrane protein [Mycetocola zhadangensis]
MLSLDLLAGAGVVAVACLYFGGVVAARRRGRGWPGVHAAAWVAGLGVGAAALLGPLAEAAHDNFPAHMAGHLLIGMLAPLLLVAGAPVTLALRALEPRQARRLSRVLRSVPVMVVSHPVSAAVLNVASLWILYTTPLFDLMTGSPFFHLLVNVHFLLAGYLFVASLVGWDPNPHRASFPIRAGVLVAALAGHGILAKYLYAHPPTGIPVAQAQSGSMLMYYGGDLADAILIGVLCLQWYRSAGRQLARTTDALPVSSPAPRPQNAGQRARRVARSGV